MLLTVETWTALSVCAITLILIVATSCRYKDLAKLPITFRRCGYTYTNNTIDFWHGMQIRDIRSLCLNFIGLNIDSQILSVSAQQDLWWLFASHFNYKSYHDILSMSLLFSATQQTFNRYLFFQMINKKQNIVILMKNEHNHIFGAYSSIGVPYGEYTNCRIASALLTYYWMIIDKKNCYYYGDRMPASWSLHMRSSCIYDPKSFIFCVKSHMHSKPVIFKRRGFGMHNDIGACYDRCFEFCVQDMILLNWDLTPDPIFLDSVYYDFDASQTEYQSNRNNRIKVSRALIECKLNIEVFQIHI
eukprot:110485_1